MKIIGSIGLVAFLASIIWLVYAFAKKQPKKKIIGALAISFLIFVIGIANTPEPKPVSAKEQLKTELKKEEPYVKSLTVKDDVLVVNTKDISLDDKTYMKDFSNILEKAGKSKLAKDGVAINQVGKYTDQKGQESKGTDFVIYYSNYEIKSINFKNYPDTLLSTPNYLLENATGYYVNYNFVQDSKIFNHSTITNNNKFIEQNFKLYN